MINAINKDKKKVIMKKIQKSLGRRHKVFLKFHSKNFLEAALIAAIIEKLNNN